jgi:serine/threonine-protein kinase
MTADDETSPPPSESKLVHDAQRAAGTRYRVLLPIGSGGSANISIAIAEGIGGFSKLVVFKTMHEVLAANRGAIQMFLEEARLSARMNHPNVVQVHEVFLQRNIPVIVMEFLDGQPLSTILAQARDITKLNLSLAISILSKVLAGLHHAHTLRDFSGEPLGLIHRDVSPHNVMVTYDGQVKLVDFGIAKIASAGHHTRTGVVKGKLTYMAPEQFTGSMDHRADIFGVGVMLWEFAARRRYWGDSLEPAVIGRLITGDLPHLRPQTDMDPEIARMCSRALAPLPEDRYATAAEMQEDLDQYLAQRGVPVTQLAIAQLVMETCGDARKKVQDEIRAQLSAHGLAVSGASGSSSEPSDASGEHLRWLDDKLNHHNDQLLDARADPAPVARRERSRPAPRHGDTPTVGQVPALRALAPGEVPEAPGALGAASDAELPRVEPPPGSLPAEAPPLRLFGGASPTARTGVALAGFGALAVIVVALGLATPDPPTSSAPLQALPGAQPPAPAAPLTGTGALPVAAAPVPPSVDARARIRINASALPNGAMWYLDDQKSESNPLQTSVAKDGQLHTLRAEAPGYEPFVKSFRFDADIDITVALAHE